MYILAAAAAARGTVGVERLDLLADYHRQLGRLRAGRDPQTDFVGLRRMAERSAVHRCCADQIDAHVWELAANTLANDLARESGSRDGIGAGVSDFALAHISRKIAHADLELARTRPAARAAHRDAVRSGFAQRNLGEIGDDVRRNVTERIGNLVE